MAQSACVGDRYRVPMQSNQWQEVTPSRFPWEREALAFVRERLPDHEPFRAWTNFEFIADDGTVNEVDLLVLTPAGLFLVEIKSRPGTLDGDAGTWTWTDSDGRRVTTDNPRLLASRKARKLASLLRRQHAFGKVACPYIDELVFCSAAGLTSRLTGPAAARACFRDPESGTPSPTAPAVAGIIGALTERACPGLQPAGRTLNREVSKAVSRALEQAGIRPSQSGRRVGDYQLEQLLYQCPKGTYQDWLATHATLKGEQRRIRIYTVGLHESQERRAQITRAAEREYRLLKALSHDGILRVSEFTQHELGPALLFSYDPKAVRLDLFLKQNGDSLNLAARLAIVRQIAEALRFAHGKGILHGGLSPQTILIRANEPAQPHVQIFSWQVGTRFLAQTTATTQRHTLTVHPEQLVEDASLLYLPPHLPETTEDETGIDVFALGAITYHLLTGLPPAGSPQDLMQKLNAEHGLNPAAAADGITPALQTLVQWSTDLRSPSRIDSAEDFLAQLARAEEHMSVPAETYVANPLDARGGELLAGGFKVIKKLGSGGTATVFLVEHKEAQVVLKLANKPDHNIRLEREFAVLRKLRHAQIVEAYELVSVGDLRGFTMEFAGEETLARRLHRDGALQPEFLQRFGEQLLDILKFLEEKGVYHRDIKPENIGVVAGKKAVSLHLFDFSLASTPLDQTEAGTPRYRDPFLRGSTPRNYDNQAERFSAAVTLYEMATGTSLRWDDGGIDPAVLDNEAPLHPELFPADLRPALQAFFARALRRAPAERFDNADLMLQSWRKAFATPPVQLGDTTLTVDTQAAIAAATYETPLASLGLSTRAQSAMELLNLLTVLDFLRVPIIQFRRLRGVGSKTREEITRLSHDLHRRFPDPIPAAPATAGSAAKKAAALVPADAPPAPDAFNIDALARAIIGATGHGRARAALNTVQVFLGLDDATRAALPVWPTQTQIARQLNCTRANIGLPIASARARWERLPCLTHVRTDLADLLPRLGGVQPVRELAAALLAVRGSNVEDETERARLALAVLRAAVEAERVREKPAFADYRADDRVLIASSDPLRTYGLDLANEAERIAGQDPLLSTARAVECLRAIVPPPDLPASLDDTGLLRLAARLSRTADLSARLELYPKGMGNLRTLRLAAGALAGSQTLTVEEIRCRVRDRYPAAQPLPDRPELDRLLRDEIGLDVGWDPTAANNAGAYRFRRVDALTLTGSSAVHTLTPSTIPAGSTPEAESRRFERKLQTAATEGAFLVLTVDPRRLVAARRQLLSRFRLELRDMDAVAIAALKAQAAAKRINWEVLVRADQAEPGTRDGENLRALFKYCRGDLESALGASDRTLLVTNPGLLARYGQMNLLDWLRGRCAVTGSPLHGAWVLVPGDAEAMPTLDGQPIPVLTSAQHAHIPSVWLEASEQ